MTKLAFSGSASQGGARLLLYSAGFLGALLCYTILFAERINVALAVAYIAGMIGVFLGWAKLAEPRYSVVCNEQGVHYHHRVGSWCLPWQAFSHSAVPDFNGKQLAFIGFKVTNFDILLQHLPLRLAVRIMTEQRPVYLESIRQRCADGQCASELLRESDVFKTPSQQYDGIKAIFANRMLQLGSACGLELMVPVNVDEVVAREWCKQINHLRLSLVHAEP